MSPTRRGSWDAQIAWSTPPSVIGQALGVYRIDLLDAIADTFEYFRGIVQARARQIAPWRNVTGDARRGLTAFVDRVAMVFTLTLVHLVAYGIFLELGTRNMGPRPAIQPAMESIYGPLMSALRRLVGAR